MVEYLPLFTENKKSDYLSICTLGNKRGEKRKTFKVDFSSGTENVQAAR